MNYINQYIRLMRRRMTNPIEKEVIGENHHVFPQSIFGKNKKTVKLTVREHFIAHKLLYKICYKRYGPAHNKTIRMLFALKSMMGDSRNSYRKETTMIVSSRLMVELRRSHPAMLQSARDKIAIAKRGVPIPANRGENNPAKRPFSRKKISESKKGKKRDDLKGKSYFGASAERVSVGIEKMIQKKTGMKIDYPKNRNSPPCSEEKARKISEARAKTKDKFVNMNEEEFVSWICEQKLYAKDGKRKNSNVTRVLMWRGIPLNEYYTCEKSD